MSGSLEMMHSSQRISLELVSEAETMRQMMSPVVLTPSQSQERHSACHKSDIPRHQHHNISSRVSSASLQSILQRVRAKNELPASAQKFGTYNLTVQLTPFTQMSPKATP